MKVKLLSVIWNKNYFKYYLKDQIVSFFITVLVFYALFMFAVPTILSGRRARHSEMAADVYIGILDNQVLIILIGCVVGAGVVFIINVMKDKPMIVGIEVKNEEFKITTRRPKRSTLKEHTGDLGDLEIIRDKIKISPIDAYYLCYRFYRKDDYIGLLIPEHFIWSENSRKEVIDALKKCSHQLFAG